MSKQNIILSLVYTVQGYEQDPSQANAQTLFRLTECSSPKINRDLAGSELGWEAILLLQGAGQRRKAEEKMD